MCATDGQIVMYIVIIIAIPLFAGACGAAVLVAALVGWRLKAEKGMRRVWEPRRF